MSTSLLLVVDVVATWPDGVVLPAESVLADPGFALGPAVLVGLIALLIALLLALLFAGLDTEVCVGLGDGLVVWVLLILAPEVDDGWAGSLLLVVTAPPLTAPLATLFVAAFAVLPTAVVAGVFPEVLMAVFVALLVLADLLSTATVVVCGVLVFWVPLLDAGMACLSLVTDWLADGVCAVDFWAEDAGVAELAGCCTPGAAGFVPDVWLVWVDVA